MSALRSFSPYPSLVLRVEEAREAERARKGPGAIRRWARRLVVSIAVIFAVLGGGAGTAQAWPWDNAVDNIGAFVTNFCGPEDLPPFTNGGGIDNVFGLNTSRPEGKIKTVAPDMSEDLAGQSGDAVDRLNSYYGGDDKSLVAKPTYKRYGFSTLTWTNFGAGCFSIGYWFSSISNFALNGLVHIPMILAMAALQFAMDNVLYEVFSAILQPIISIFTAIFKPWILFIAPIGVFVAYVRSRGALQPTLKAAVWVICIFGVFLWMGNHTGTVVTKANNFVTEFAGSAACKMSAETQGTECDPNDPMAEIMQSLWYGVPYQTWLSGEVGDQQAKEDKALAADGKVGIGPAVLNGMYVNPGDDTGKKVLRWRAHWNSLSYLTDVDDSTKVASWTGARDDGENGHWGSPFRYVPFLATVKFICNDTTKDGEDTDDKDKNRWFYGGSCDSGGAGTAHMVSNFTGQAYAQQMVTAFAGGVSALAVVLAIGVCAMYLALQKMLFYFLLAFGPIFLAISTFADDKRRQFATRYFEMLAANVIKQCAAVCAVLFVSYSMAALLFPPTGSDIPDIPWVLKPFFAILFFIALLLFAVPLKNIMKAAVAGDASVVDRTAKAPVDAAKAAGKAAVVIGAAAATGGASMAATGALAGAGGAATAGGLASSAGGMAKGASLLTRAGQMAGTRGGVGKMLNTAGKGLDIAGQMGKAQAQKAGVKRAISNGTDMLLKGPGGGKYKDAQGNVTKMGRAQAEKDFKAMTKADPANARASKAGIASRAQQQYMDKAFRGYRAQNGGQLHPSDPRNPASRALPPNQNGAQEAVAGSLKDDPSKQPRRGQLNGSPENRGAVGPGTSSDFTNGGHSNGSNNGTNGGNAEQTQRFYAEQARERVSGPEFGRSEDIKAQINLSGADVLSSAGLNRSEVENNPVKLLTSDAYGGGDTSRMDPMHPATEPLTNLRFAASSGNEQDIQVAVLSASEAIGQHGVPSDVSAVRSYGESAQTFEPVNVVGAMPNLSADSSWQDRADGAVTMQSAISQMPAEHPAAEAMQNYVSALSTPTVDMGTVDALKVQAIEAFDQPEPTQPISAPQPIAPQPDSYDAPSSAGLFEAPQPTHASEPQSWGDQPATPSSYDATPTGGVDTGQLADALGSIMQNPGGSPESGSGEQVRDAVAQGIREAHNEAAPGGSSGVDLPPPPAGGPSGGGRTDGGLFGGSEGPADEGPDPEPLLPRGEDDAPALNYRRSRRRRRSGLYDYDDNSDSDSDFDLEDDQGVDDRDGDY